MRGQLHILAQVVVHLVGVREGEIHRQTVQRGTLSEGVGAGGEEHVLGHISQRPTLVAVNVQVVVLGDLADAGVGVGVAGGEGEFGKGIEAHLQLTALGDGRADLSNDRLAFAVFLHGGQRLTLVLAIDVVDGAGDIEEVAVGVLHA